MSAATFAPAITGWASSWSQGSGTGFTKLSGDPAASNSIASLKMLGGQPTGLNAHIKEPLTCDLMKRARCLAPVAGQYYETPTELWVTSLTRVSNTTTAVVQVNTPLNNQPIYTGQKLNLTCVPDSSFSVEQVSITRIDNTTFTYPNTATNKTLELDTIYDSPAHLFFNVNFGAAGHPIQDFRAVISTNSGSDADNPELAGTYSGVFSGSAPSNITSVGGTITNYTPGGSTFTLVVTAADTAFLQLVVTGVAGDGSFRLPSIVRVDHPQTNTPFLRPDTKQHYQRFAVLRMMDAGKINNNAWELSWANRPKVTYGSGLPIEDMVAMCNELKSDLWFCFPTWAKDDYIDGAATYIRDNLSSTLKCYFEDGNEVWNSGAFAQWHWHLARAREELQMYLKGIDGVNQITSIVRASNTLTVSLNQACRYTTGQTVAVQVSGADTSCNTTGSPVTVSGSTFSYANTGADTTFTVSSASVYGNLSSNLLPSDWSPYTAQNNYVARRTYEISQRVKTIFGGTLNTRARCVLMWQLDNTVQSGGLWYMLRWLDSHYGAPSNYLYAIGGAPYAQTTGTETTVAQIATAMMANIDGQKNKLHYLKYLSTKYQLKAFNYEGGPDTTFVSPISLVDSFWVSDEMRVVQEYVLTTAYAYGVDLHVQYLSSLRWHGYSGNTSWGIGNSLAEVLPRNGATAPKAIAIDNIRKGTIPVIQDPITLTNSIVYRNASSTLADDADSTFVNNGMLHMYNATSTVEKLIYVPEIERYCTFTVFGKVVLGSGSVNARIYVDNVLEGTVEMYSDGTGIDAGTPGGYASVTTLAVTLTKGWHVVKIAMPTSVPDAMGISKIDVQNPLRLTIDGSTLRDPNNQPITLRGVNQGAWGENLQTDAREIRVMGANCVRTLIRWWGEYSNNTIDCRDGDVANDYINPAHLQQFLQEIDWIVAQKMWVVVAMDSDCGQNGLQDTATIAYCDPTSQYPTTGRNFWSDPATRQFFKQAWKRIASELKSRSHIAMFELLPEPLGNRDATWADDILEFYRDLIATVREVDQTTPFLIGARGGYNILLTEECYLPERTDVIYTGNMLNPKVVGTSELQNTVLALTNVRDTHNVPILVQQLGRRSGEDTDLAHMKAALSICNSRGVPYTWWQYHQNTTNPDEYALYYKDGVGGWTPKTNEINALSYYFTQTYAALESAAIAAATAANAELIYIKADLSNVYQTSGTTTPVTSVGQPIGRISGVVGTLSLTQTTAGSFPSIAAGPNSYVWALDGIDDFLSLSSSYFVSGDDTIVISSGQCASGSTNRVLFHCGTAGVNPRYPYLGLDASDNATASWRGDDTQLQVCTGTTNQAVKAVVLTAHKVGADKKLFVNGVQEGTTNTTAVGALSSVSRARSGYANNNVNGWSGTVSLLCVSKTMTTQQQQDIERFAAFLAGAAYRQ